MLRLYSAVLRLTVLQMCSCRVQVDVFSFGVLAYELLGRVLMSAGMGPRDIEAALEHLKKVNKMCLGRVFGPVPA
jgi:hypothetical protein